MGAHCQCPSSHGKSCGFCRTFEYIGAYSQLRLVFFCCLNLISSVFISEIADMPLMASIMRIDDGSHHFRHCGVKSTVEFRNIQYITSYFSLKLCRAVKYENRSRIASTCRSPNPIPDLAGPLCTRVSLMLEIEHQIDGGLILSPTPYQSP